ncbi:MAG: peptidoglycan LD-endopeptidase LytH [Solirubrobacteraceae bacterium]|jgi:murein DD-endopeptidase MepM/ murein hydrolase activator NlpD|nr:peptidoglycan LD-endopeptidase LytH [Solirubrobacteraceae bacterium]
MRAALVALAAGTTAAGPGAVPPGPAGFAVAAARVTPRHAYVAGKPARIAFAVDAPAPLALEVDVVREATGRPVRRFALSAVAPGVAAHVEWDGLTGRGDVAPGGRYRVRVRAPGGTARTVGALTLRSHVYPIRGPHADRGPIGEFGVPRSGGRRHDGFDVDAACGTPVVAARGGRVVRARYDPVLYGNLVIIRGDHTRRDYWYAHLRRPSRLRRGDHVRTGERIGRIGATGNARTVGCHLHFEIRLRGVPIDPERELHAWDRWS